jgi:hypothetical protein
MNAERRLPIGAQDAILPHISNFDFSQLLTLPAFFIIMGRRTIAACAFCGS